MIIPQDEAGELQNMCYSTDLLKANAERDWISCLGRSSRVRMKLICFSHAGAISSPISTWAHSIRKEVELCRVVLPGRRAQLNGETPITSLPEMVSSVARTVATAPEPFAFFGHSMGALLAFEVTRELRRTSCRLPLHLFLAGHRAPHMPRRKPPIHLLPVDLFCNKLRAMGGIPDEILNNRELCDLFLPALRADLAMCETYVYKNENPLPCPIYVLGGVEDDEALRDELLQWKYHTTGDFNLRILPGNHFFIDSHSELLLSVLSRELNRLLERIP
jgi:medium-chain acyl-[acyl-carrier-protein] hydrolase